MGGGKSKAGGGGSAKQMSFQQAQNNINMRKDFMDALGRSEAATKNALDDMAPGSSFSLQPEGSSQQVDYRKDTDGRWQMTRSNNGVITQQFMIDSDTTANHAYNWKNDLFGFNIKGATPISQKSVNVRDSDYRGAHGKAPSGRGNWAFDIGGKTVFFSGKFSDAKKKATEQAAKQGIRQIMTLG